VHCSTTGVVVGNYLRKRRWELFRSQFPNIEKMHVIAARAAAIRVWPLSPAKPNRDQAFGDVLQVELLSKAEMNHYFPGCTILPERVLGLTKSIIAVK
jgi:hypothetical protein